MLLATAPQSWAGSDTWTGATSGAWHTAGNWAAGSVPASVSDIASFGASANIDVSISQGMALSGINFNAGADSFTISQTTAVPMTFGDQGVINNSDVTQTFEIAPWLYLEKLAFFNFRGNATAGNKTKFVLAGAYDDFLIGGWSIFYDDASAASAVFELNGANTDLGMGGRVNFYESSTAGDATFWLHGNKGIGNDLESVAGTLVSFHDTTTAGNAVFNLSAGIDPLSRGSILSFEGHSSAENATINVHPLPLGTGQTARVIFEANASAGNATIVLASIFGNDMPSTLDFLGAATGGTSTIWLRGINQLRIDGSAGVSIGSLEGDSTSRVKLGSKKLTIGTNNKSTIMRGVLEGEGGSLGKTGTGMLTLTGNSTYTGVTSVTGAGELRVTGSLVGDTELNFGGTLSGNGVLAGVTAGLGAVVAPGPGADTLTTGDLTLTAASTVEFDLTVPGTAGGAGNDLIVVEGDLVLNGLLDLNNSDDMADGIYTLLTYTGTLTDSGLTLGDVSDDHFYTVDTSQPNVVTLEVIRANPSLALASALDFGVRLYNAAPVSRILNLQNDGNVALSVGNVLLGGPDRNEFAVSENTCSETTLAVAEQCSITLSHSGSTVGVRTAIVTIQSDADDSPHPVALAAGVVAPPALSGLNGASLEFQAGASPLQIDVDASAELTVPGAVNLAGATLQVELISGADADDLLSFSTTGDISLSASSVGSDVRVDGVVIATLDNAIAAGEALGVTFNSNATLARVQLLLQAITYQNTNTINPTAGVRDIRVSLTYLGQLASATLSANVLVSKTLSLSVAELDFGTRTYNATAPSRELTVQNTGNIPVNLAGSAISGADGGGFVIVTDTCSDSVLAVGGECTATISHQDNTPGVSNAILSIQSDADGNPHELTLTARVVGEPVVQNLGDTVRPFVIGAAPLLLDADAQALVSVPGAQNLAGGSLLVEMLPGADGDEDMLTFSAIGPVTLSADEAGSDVRIDGVVIGTLGNALAVGETLAVIFNADATPAHVQVLIQQLSYQNLNATDPVTGVRNIGITLSYLDMDAAVTVAVNVQAPPPPPPPSTGGNITTEVVDQTLNGTVQIGAGGVIRGGTINGDVTGNGEVTGDVTMGAGATISGARITGNLVGNASDPARLNGGTVTGDAALSNVVIAADVVLEPGLTLGEGVTFESPGLIDAVQSIEVFDAGGATVMQLANGQITVSGDGYEAVTLPVAIVQAQTGQAPGVYYGDNGDILLITEDGLGIRAYARHVDSASLQNMLSDMSLQITFTPSGQMLVSSTGPGDDSPEDGRMVMALQADETYFSARPDVLAIPAHRGDTTGLLEYPVVGLGTVQHLSSLFLDDNGIVMQQDLVPAPVDWLALKSTLRGLPGVTAASIDTRGTIQVTVEGTTLHGVMDYAVTRGAQGESAVLTLDVVGDLTGNGMDDYRVTYDNGDQQLLFVYRLE